MKKNVCDILVSAGLAKYDGRHYFVSYITEDVNGKRMHKNKKLQYNHEINTEWVEGELPKGEARVGLGFRLFAEDILSNVQYKGTENIKNGRKYICSPNFELKTVESIKHKVFLGILTKLAIDGLKPKGDVHIWEDNRVIDEGYIYVYGACHV